MAVSISNTIVVHDDRALANIPNFRTINGNAILGAGDITPTSDMNLIGIIRTNTGAAANLSSLNLTSYNYLVFIVHDFRLRGNDGQDARMTLGQTTADDVAVSEIIAGSSGTALGRIEVYLNNGVASALLVDTFTSTTDVIEPRSRQTPLRSNSTTITISTDDGSGTLQGGNVFVYGVFGAA